MLDCTITATAAAKTDLTVLVVGHCHATVPAVVEQLAASIAKGTAGAPAHVLTDDGRYLLVKPDSKPWLVGGESWRLLGKEVVDALRQARLTSATVLVAGDATDPQALAEGVLLADYRYDALRSGKDGKRTALTVRFPGHSAAVAAAQITAKAQNLARELADTPPNVINPKTFAERAVSECRKAGLKTKVISGTAALRAARFPGLVQVGQAGSEEPRLVEIRYVPAKKTAKKSKRALALVGKGITFDSGGISLKPSDKMWEMKGDCGGAAAVLGAMIAIAASKPSIPVTGYLALAENLPDSKAQRPGDIYVARNGKTIHVDNTDAEGRLVLADVLTYAAEQGATHIVDAATLTGACLVALGMNIGGLLGRDQPFLDLVRNAGQKSGEELWQLPLFGEYRSLIDFPQADINNTGGRNGGTITAALFLAEFVPENVSWAHLDIAGPAIHTSGWRYYAKGMTGFATRTLARVAHDLAGH